jgi:hypothetical protein
MGMTGGDLNMGFKGLAWWRENGDCSQVGGSEPYIMTALPAPDRKRCLALGRTVVKVGEKACNVLTPEPAVAPLGDAIGAQDTSVAPPPDRIGVDV